MYHNTATMAINRKKPKIIRVLRSFIIPIMIIIVNITNKGIHTKIHVSMGDTCKLRYLTFAHF